MRTVGNAGKSVTPNARNHPTPAVTRTRGVGDAAPYGRVINVGISIVVNSRVNTANLLPPLGSPERGAVAARSAVTEGLVQRPCGEITLPVNPRTVGAGFHARPAWDEGHRGCVCNNGARAVPAGLHTLGGGGRRAHRE